MYDSKIGEIIEGATIENCVFSITNFKLVQVQSSSPDCPKWQKVLDVAIMAIDDGAESLIEGRSDDMLDLIKEGGGAGWIIIVFHI